MAAGFATALAATAVPSVAGAQRAQAPGPDTRKVLVTTFRGDQEAGIKLADELRNRVASEYNIRQLMPNPKKDIDNTLIQSGYRPDSALSPNDIKELGKLIRADEIIDGTITKNGTSYRISARMFLPRDVSISQPLVTNLETANLGDAAKQIVREYDVARKQIKDNDDCTNAIRANTVPVAITAARKGIATYPKATISRLCLASAYAAMKTTADSTGPWKDSVIAITAEIMKLDPASRIAYQLQYDAYKSKSDTSNALRALVGLMNADPTNQTLREQVISELVLSGKPEIAIPTAKQLVVDNPGDPQYARTYWLVLRAAKNYKESVPAGIAFVTIDTAQADSNYFNRQIADLVADSSFAKAAEMAAAASGKYPTNTSFLLVKAQNERRAGQLPAAKATLERALSVDPKVNGANYLLAQIAGDMKIPADAIKFAKLDAADPANKERAANLLLTLGNAAYKAAVDTKNPDDFKAALPYLESSAEINPNPNAFFLIGVTAYQAMAGQADKLRTSRSCDEFKAANDLLTLVNINMPKGGSVDAKTAGQILGGAQQFAPFIEGNLRRLNCK